MKKGKKVSVKQKEVLTDFAIVVVGNVFFAMICGVGIQFLRLSSNSKMSYSYLEDFLIVVFLLTTVLSFIHLIIKLSNENKQNMETIDNTENNTQNNCVDSSFAKVEETSMVIGGNENINDKKNSLSNNVPTDSQEQEFVNEVNRQEIINNQMNSLNKSDIISKEEEEIPSSFDESSSSMSDEDINNLIQMDENESSLW